MLSSIEGANLIPEDASVCLEPLLIIRCWGSSGVVDNLGFGLSFEDFLLTVSILSPFSGMLDWESRVLGSGDP